MGFFTYSDPLTQNLRENLSISDGGKVGINNIDPQATLDIHGTFRLRGNGAGAGKILSSDPLGNAIWQNFAVWNLGGNAGTSGSNFLGTTDAAPLNFKIYGLKSGIIDSLSFNTGFGFRTMEIVDFSL